MFYLCTNKQSTHLKRGAIREGLKKIGYSTDFNGTLSLGRELTEVEKNYINTFSSTRRMKRDVNKLMEKYKGLYGLPLPIEGKTPEEIYGLDGEYFVYDDGDFGQSNDGTIIDYNIHPGAVSYGKVAKSNLSLSVPENSGVTEEKADEFISVMDVINENNRRAGNNEACPGLWCQWVINDDNELEWDGSEKFYGYTDWLRYLINRFFEPWGVKLNGQINWRGEDFSDYGRIDVVDNIVTVTE